MRRLRRYRWSFLVLGLHTGLICFAHIEGKHGPLVWIYPMCFDFPVTPLIVALGDYLKQLTISASTREFILALCFALGGGAQWFAITAIITSRFRHPPPHCCQSCGYDLTGNTSGVCPECGRIT